VLCPKCGEFGFISGRWVSSSYYPKFASISCNRLEKEEQRLSKNPSSEGQKRWVDYFRNKVRGTIYRGRSRIEDIPDKKSLYRVTYGKYFCFYIGHYDKEKYKEQIIKYHEGKIKSRPNGRRWCKIHACFHKSRIIYHPSGRYVKLIKSSPHTNMKIF
jgi:hypothetical protein